MKNKITLIIIFACLFSLQLNAQISRTVYGLELGSDLQTTKTILNNKGLDYVVQDGSLGLTIIVKEPFFAGIQWDGLFVSFEQNKAYHISFHKQCTEVLDKMNLILEMTKLLVDLNEKYSQYQDSTLNKANNSNTNDGKIQFYLKDGTTDIVLDGDLKKYGTSHMILAYIDDQLFNLRNARSASDDL